MHGEKIKFIKRLTDIPLDILTNEIIAHLSIKDFFYLSIINKHFYELLYTKNIWLKLITNPLMLYLPILFVLSSAYKKAFRFINPTNNINLEDLKFLDANDDFKNIVQMIGELTNTSDFSDENITLFEINKFIKTHQLNENATFLHELLKKPKLTELAQFTFYLYELIRTISDITLVITNTNESLRNLSVFENINTFQLTIEKNTNKMDPNIIIPLLKKIKPSNIKLSCRSYGTKHNITNALLAAMVKIRLTSFELWIQNIGLNADLWPLITKMETLFKKNATTLHTLNLFIAASFVDDENEKLTTYNYNDLSIGSIRIRQRLLKTLGHLKNLEKLVLPVADYGVSWKNYLDVLTKLPPQIKYLHISCILSVEELETLITKHIPNPNELIEITFHKLILKSPSDCIKVYDIINQYCPNLKKFNLHFAATDGILNSEIFLIEQFVCLDQNDRYNCLSASYYAGNYFSSLDLINYNFSQPSVKSEQLTIKATDSVDLQIKFMSKFFGNNMFEEKKLRELFKKETNPHVIRNCATLWNALMKVKAILVKDFKHQSAHRKIYIGMLSQLISTCELNRVNYNNLNQLGELYSSSSSTFAVLFLFGSKELKKFQAQFELVLKNFFESIGIEMKQNLNKYPFSLSNLSSKA